MKIYQVKVDVNKYQYFLPSDEEIWKTDRLTFDCSPKLAEWTPPEVYVYEPKHRPGNFLSFLMGGALVCDPEATEALLDLLEMSGELLPLPYGGRTYHVLNVTECFNAIDEERTDWIIGEETKVRIGIRRYAFHRNRLPEVPLFKIPETCRGEILTVEGMKDPDDEFKPRVERLGLKGLVFKEIWRDAE
jgi:hypothetical protein